MPSQSWNHRPRTWTEQPPFVGFSVGEGVGFAVGTAVGASVGCAVGEDELFALDGASFLLRDALPGRVGVWRGL